MAFALNLPNEILSVFDNLHRKEMRSNDLHRILNNRNIQISMDEIIQIVRSSSLSNLFNVQSLSNDSYVIQLSPKLTLCEYFLRKGCRNKMQCTKLHVCRFISHAFNRPLDKPCYYPHKLSQHSHNVLLLKQFNYDALDEDILLHLLRLHYTITSQQSRAENQINSNQQSSFQPSRFHSNDSQAKGPICPPTPTSQLNKPSVLTDNVIEGQLDISIPSQQDANDIDLEIVELILAGKDIIIEQILSNQTSNEFYRRYTIQLKTKQIIDNILQNEPIIMYNNIPMKMKRTMRQKDKCIFALKFDTDQKIDNTRLNLYVKMLVGKVHSNVFDMTNDDSDEQLHLIRCDEPIDFEHLHQTHKAKNILQGYHVTVIEVYEAEALAVSFVNRSLHQSMTLSRLRQWIGEHRWQQDVFACLCIQNGTNAEIELMSPEVTSKWLSEASRIEKDLSLVIHPIIDFIRPPEKKEEDQDEEIINLLAKTKLSPSISPSSSIGDSQKAENDLTSYPVKPDWRIVLTHPTFGDEYKKYIRENLNIPVQITGSSIQLPNAQIRKEFARYTNMFIQKFIFHEVSNLDGAQVKIIKSNYTRMAHKWQQNTNITLIAARRDTMGELFPSLSLPNQQQKKPRTTPAFTYRPPSTPRKQEQQSTPLIAEQPRHESPTTQIKSNKDQIQTLSYPIENSVYFPFFSSTNSFPGRLNTYLSNSFNIKLDIKPVSSTKIVLELIGQPKDVSDARPVLTSLFASLKTKIYSDSNSSCKFSIPDLYRVVQLRLDKCSIVSSCSFSTRNDGVLLVRYFADHPQFGVDEKEIDDVVQRSLFNISYPVETTSKKLGIKFEELEKKIKQRTDYGENICCLYKYQKGSTDQTRLISIHLCGTESVVRELYQEFKKISDEYLPIPCNIQLNSDQVNFLLTVYLGDLIEFEKQNETDGVDLRSKLKNEPASQFIAPKYLHAKIKLFILEMSQLKVLSKEIKCAKQLIHKKKDELYELALKSRCLLSITLSPQATAFRRMAPTISKVSSETINISNGDLTTERADVLVVCSSSAKLCGSVIRAAGKQVEQELNEIDLTKNATDTSVGNLKQAKRLLFLPWTPPASFLSNQDTDVLRQSISAFVKQAIQFTIQRKFKSIAFPAIGCGGFGIQPDIIAKTMINAVREELTADPTNQLVVTFAVQQAHVYDVFNATLKGAPIGDGIRSHSLSDQEKFTITLTTSNSHIQTANNLLTTIENVLVPSFSS
ncbi:unnamed protein product [Rotaria magnacalcarata]|uniref:Macro domain-containing protein n=5 Tax=Rotaria magnacalcarata TaxID=392030 RepID=A0A819FAM3_9BILA|nr:unnamed protein product [Rotaria magnacalcarata]CAF3865392.1 unnamed protein product [Rotaria magnacalcarata]